jgi:hypothetical protein
LKKWGDPVAAASLADYIATNGAEGIFVGQDEVVICSKAK